MRRWWGVAIAVAVGAALVVVGLVTISGSDEGASGNAGAGGGIRPPIEENVAPPGPAVQAPGGGQPGTGGPPAPPEPAASSPLEARERALDRATKLGLDVSESETCTTKTVGELREFAEARAADDGGALDGVLQTAPQDLPLYLCPLLLDDGEHALALIAAADSPVRISSIWFGSAAVGIPGVPSL